MTNGAINPGIGGGRIRSNGLRRNDKISHHKTFRSYIDTKKFAVPAGFPAATSVVIVAYRTPMLRFNVHFRGRLLESLRRKLREFPPASDREQFSILTRNLGVLLRG